MVQQVEDLGLHRVEELEALRIQLLQDGVLESRDRQRLEVQEIGVDTFCVGSNEVLERNRANSFCTKPAIRNDTHVNLARQRIRQGDGEVQFVFIIQLLTAENEILMMVDLRSLGVLNPNPERFRCTVVAIIPCKLGIDRKSNAKNIAIEWSNFSLNTQSWEVVEKFGKHLAHLLVVNQISNLCWFHLSHRLNGRRWNSLIQVTQDRLRQIKLVERMVEGPNLFLDRFAKRKQHLALVSPSTIQRNHEQGATNTSSILGNITGVRNQREIFNLCTRDVRLKQDVGLGVRRIIATFDFSLSYFISEALEFLGLRLVGLDVVEFTTHTDHLENICFTCARTHHLVEDLDTVLENIVLTSNATNVFRFQVFRLLVEDNHLALLQSASSLDDELSSSLDQHGVISKLGKFDTIVAGFTLHANKQIGVTKPLDSLGDRGDSTERDLGIQIVNQSG